jgi:uncharacterized Zn finger protein
MPGTCPKCSQTVTALKGESVQADFGHAGFWAILLKCPSCGTILSTQIDPTLLREETVKRITDDVADRMKGGKGTEPPPRPPQPQG